MRGTIHPIEQKLAAVIKHMPTGFAEIDRAGMITHLNEAGCALLKPIRVAYNLQGNSLFEILEKIAPEVVEKIRVSGDRTGDILVSEIHRFCLLFGGENIERHFSFTVNRVSDDCVIVNFDDITQKRRKEQAIQQLVSERAVIQGKFEIASNILHDIGNGVVGFGSYVSRIRRSLEQTDLAGLQKLSDFFAVQQTALADIMGEAKAGAVVKMIAAITDAQRTCQEEIKKSVAEQQNIITHIQDILNIQRQYVSGNESLEKKPINLRSIITDCMSMLFASIEKRQISVSVNIPDVLPVINGDRTRLMQVILNILKNSIEAIDPGASRKTIALSVTIEDDMLALRLKDSGHGFDKATGKQIFMRGFTTKASGTGLGLDNCRAIIESHNGTIDIASEGFGKGAVTTIRFKF